MKAWAMAAPIFLLGACAGRGVNVAMTTSLEPGETLTIRAWGATPVARVVNHGPGEVTLLRDGGEAPFERLGSPGATDLAGVGAVRVNNASSQRTTIDVGITGAKSAEIKGPVVGQQPRADPANSR